ncbi:MAG TPA: F0F1 ATP synthase subunit A [Candidatus Eremiobacteraceae bacterium]|nr:F0F1 ATP synthase subunit A [Candidatus Eremiobacteraceae bacterium]
MQETIGSHPLWHLKFLPAPFDTVHADTVIITWLTMGLALAVVGMLAATHPVTVVSKRYSIMELSVSALSELTTGILGKNGAPFVPYVISIFVFILLLNEIGLFPFIGKSPTADLNTTAALAVTTILLIQLVGIRRHGLGYYKHLFIKPWYLGVAMLPINIIDELARPVTLAMRLFGNIFAGEVLLVVASAMILAHLGFLSTIAKVFPLGIFAFNMIIGIIQALVFTLLTIAYLITPTQETSDH